MENISISDPSIFFEELKDLKGIKFNIIKALPEINYYINLLNKKSNS